ncbi:HNH endonuclease signature motif containing protein [Streptomyces sp. NPDC057250]|uniref:HNH endonuclease signature motif containing protein n=1 Tax=Streptomyces sp. NPDC057250 TaxID=3346068 RepID=UPI003633D9AE
MNVHDFTAEGWPPLVGLRITDSHGSIDMPGNKLAEFYGKITRTENGCWEWQGPQTQAGYGRLNITNRYWYTHRLSHELHTGAIPAGMHVDHLCRNRICCNPAHLEPVSAQENTLRSPVAIAALNAAKTHCQYGHPLTDGNLVSRPGSSGRCCRTCHLWHIRVSRAKKRGKPFETEPPKDVAPQSSSAARSEVCRNGHRRTEENTLQTTSHRRCRICAADARKRYNERQAVNV